MKNLEEKEKNYIKKKLKNMEHLLLTEIVEIY